MASIKHSAWCRRQRLIPCIVLLVLYRTRLTGTYARASVQVRSCRATHMSANGIACVDGGCEALSATCWWRNQVEANPASTSCLLQSLAVHGLFYSEQAPQPDIWLQICFIYNRSNKSLEKAGVECACLHAEYADVLTMCPALHYRVHAGESIYCSKQSFLKML